jgi:hypothetical protein
LYWLVYGKDPLSAILRTNFAAGERGQARRLAVLVASLGLGRIIADSPPAFAYKLAVKLAREVKIMDGLLKHRTVGVTRANAFNALLLSWDTEQFDFNLKSLVADTAPAPPDPDPGPAGTSAAADADASLPCSSALTIAHMDFRTRELERCVSRLALRGRMQSRLAAWRRRPTVNAYLLEGATLDSWRIIDAYVIRAELTWPQRREAGFEVKLVASRNQVNNLTRERDAAVISAQESMSASERARAQTDSARSHLQRDQALHRDQMLAAKTANMKEAQVVRRQHAQQVAELRGEIRNTSIRCRKRVDEVESELSRLENTVKKAARQQSIRDGQVTEL